MKQFYSVEELANELNVTTRTIRNYLRDGRLKGSKVGGQWRFSMAEVAKLMGKEHSEDQNDLTTRFLEEVHVTNQAVIVLDFPSMPSEQIEAFKEAVIEYYNQMYVGGSNRLFSYQLLPNKLMRFSLSGPSPYVLAFSRQIYRIAERFQ
ncbi:helix-turn-helix domain-containing protein [Enterococcus olivae]